MTDKDCPVTAASSVATVTTVPDVVLLAGFGLANQAVAQALIARSHNVKVFDDKPSLSAQSVAESLNLDLIVAPDSKHIAALIKASDMVIPTPGLPECHDTFNLAEAAGVDIASEFDLARAWDSRCIVATTGTSGKTTVTEMVESVLRVSGVAARVAGNTGEPLVSAIEHMDTELFVVEASSFRLSHSRNFHPSVGCWLNFAPDHLDVHRNISSYEQAKAKLWRNLPVNAIAVANQNDTTVMSHISDIPRSVQLATFASQTARSKGNPHVDHARYADHFCHWYQLDEKLIGPFGVLCHVNDLKRNLPHDIENSLATAAIATSSESSGDVQVELADVLSALPEVLATYEPSNHRVQKVAVVNNVEFYNDSKATTPHATVAALKSFESVVLIAGGRNKGLDLTGLTEAIEHVHAVVSLGEASDELQEVFACERQVVHAEDMDDAVRAAARLACPSKVVLLSPACASFDVYQSYAERGEDFMRAVADFAARR